VRLQARAETDSLRLTDSLARDDGCQPRPSRVQLPQWASHPPAATHLQAPVPFEFDISQPRASAAFAVEPAAGVVPGDGNVVVQVTFTPTGAPWGKWGGIGVE